MWAHAKRSGWALGTTLLLGLVAGPAVEAQSEAKTSDETAIAGTLDAAREKYEAEMEAVRELVLKKLQAAEDAARRGSKPNENGLAETKKARADFLKDGTWPELAALKPVEERAARAHNALARAYEVARKAYVRAGDDAVAQALSDERDHWENDDDVVPWSALLLSNGQAASQPATLGSDLQELRFLAPKGVNYRLEVCATRLAGSGGLAVEFPVDKERAYRLELAPACDAAPNKESRTDEAADDATTSDDAKVRLLLTVHQGVVNADLGAPRPLPEHARDVRRTADAPLAIKVDDQATRYEIESVRTKPVRVALTALVKPPAKPEKPGPQEAKASPQSVGARFAARTALTGQWQMAGSEVENVQATVTRIDGHEIALHISLSCASYDFVLTIDGDNLTNLHVLGTYRGKLLEQRGGGTIDGDTITVNFRWRIQNRWRDDIEKGWLKLTKK